MWQTILKLVMAIGLYFSPVREIFVLMIGFAAIDLIAGVIASTRRSVPRTSRRLRKSVTKILCYIAAVMLAFWAEQVLQIEWFASHRFIAGLICVVEFISILENLAVISGHPVFLKIIKLVRGKASQDDVINEILNEKNGPFGAHCAAPRHGLSDSQSDSEFGDPHHGQRGDPRDDPGHDRHHKG